MAELLDGPDHPVVLPQPFLGSESQHRVDEGDIDGDGARFGEVVRFVWAGHPWGL
jgi:hypothetical protein